MIEVPAAGAELTPGTALLFALSSTAIRFAGAVVALRLAAMWLLRFLPSWRRSFAASVAAILAGIAASELLRWFIGDFANGALGILIAILVIAAVYARFLRPPESAPLWKFFVVAALQIAAVALLHGFLAAVHSGGGG